jgi:putative membrane protein insertion efficiency factor
VQLLLAAIRTYQIGLAPLMPSVCKFYPTCSHYAAEAIARHGARHGVILAARRLWRCRPFTQGGVDLVPDPEDVAADSATPAAAAERGHVKAEVHR